MLVNLNKTVWPELYKIIKPFDKNGDTILEDVSVTEIII